MTEEEAKTKWCPFARVAYDKATFNRFNDTSKPSEHNIPYGAKCIGSKCMAWRWEYVDCDATGGGRIQTDIGYCGLSGNP